MSHGGGESECVHGKSTRRNLSRKNDEFAHAVAKIAVSQICEGAGFQSFQQSALETLSDVAIRYLRNVVRSAQAYANFAGRSECNTFDFIQSFEEHSSAQGFVAASNVDHCLAMSGTVKEIVQFVSDAENGSFGYSVPLFPVDRESKPLRSFLDVGKEPPGKHIPPWLPVFPVSHDLHHSNSEGDGDASLAAMEKCEVRNTLDVRSQHVSNGSEMQQLRSVSAISKGKEALHVNPFLAAPLPFGAKEVSEVLPPAKILSDTVSENKERTFPHPILEVDTLTPTVQGSIPDANEGQKKPFLHQGPAVHFKLAVEKKGLARSSELRLLNKDVDKNEPWFATSDEKDVKRTRAEKILKQSMEIVEELAQL